MNCQEFTLVKRWTSALHCNLRVSQVQLSMWSTTTITYPSQLVKSSILQKYSKKFTIRVHKSATLLYIMTWGGVNFFSAIWIRNLFLIVLLLSQGLTILSKSTMLIMLNICLVQLDLKLMKTTFVTVTLNYHWHCQKVISTATLMIRLFHVLPIVGYLLILMIITLILYLNTVHLITASLIHHVLTWQCLILSVSLKELVLYVDNVDVAWVLCLAPPSVSNALIFSYCWSYPSESLELLSFCCYLSWT